MSAWLKIPSNHSEVFDQWQRAGAELLSPSPSCAVFGVKATKMARPMKSATVLTRRIASRGNIFFRTHATSTEKSLEKSYSNTLLLPKTTFPLWSDSSKREVPFRSKTTEELYHYQVGLLLCGYLSTADPVRSCIENAGET
jgi:hypothetical protein